MSGKPAAMGSGNIQSIHRLSPLQEGILFHTLETPGSDVYFQQFSCILENLTDPDRWQRAWQDTAHRHAVLRTLFTWDKRPQPLQIVRKEVSFQWDCRDWQDRSAERQGEDWALLLKQDRSDSFDLSRAPLCRFTLVQTGHASYRFLWTFHHIILDGWSQRLLLQHALDYYRNDEVAAERGQGPQYDDFLRWLDTIDGQADRRFWTGELGDFSAPSWIAGDQGAKQRGQGEAGSDTLALAFSAELLAKLGDTARARQLTMNTFLLAAWSLVLGSHTGSTDVVFGTTVSGRSPDLAGAEEIAGLMINTLPVRTRIPFGSPVEAWLRALQAKQLDCAGHQHTPLVDIQKCAGLASGTPLFDSILVFENLPGGNAAGYREGSLSVSGQHYRERSHYPFALLVEPGGEFAVTAVYDRDRVGRVKAERLLKQLQRTLDSLCDTLDAPVEDLQILPAAELAQTLIGLNAPPVAFPAHRCMHEIIEDQAEATPDAVALRCGAVSLTFADLNASANRLAHYLLDQGIGRGAPVPVMLERGPEAIIALLAVLKCGSAYIPLEVNIPPGRLDSVLADIEGDKPLLITRARYAPAQDKPTCRPVCVDLIEAELERLPGTNPAARASPEDLAYLIYTSGSTGNAKGVMVEHRSLVNSTWARMHYYSRQPGSFLLLSSLAVDSSVAGIYWSLCSGATLVLPEPGMEQRVEEVGKCIEEMGVTHLLCIPRLYQLILENNPAARLETISTAVVAGEACTPGVVELHQRQLPEAELHNEYGPSECTVWATVANLTRWSGGSPVTIGRPIANTWACVLDEHRRPVPLGVPGELCLGGEGLARGYLGRPEATVAAFISDARLPASVAASATRLYRTGDRVRCLESSELQFLGRVDNQLKIRGFRLEPEEVERVLATHPSVEEVIVLCPASQAESGALAHGSVVTGYAGEGRLTACLILLRNAPSPSVGELQDVAREALPDYMVPQVYHFLENFPRTASGKVDRARLNAVISEIDQTIAPDSAGYVAPRNEVEAALAAIWAEVLGLEQVGIHQDFFYSGGDSLLSIRILARANKAGLRIAPEDFFSHPTIAEQATLASASSDSRVSRPEVLDACLSPVQRWFFERFQSSREQWNLCFLVRVPEHWDYVSLEKAVERLFLHHPTLRVTFRQSGGNWRQRIGAPLSRLPVQRLDLTRLAGQALDAALVGQADSINRAFDLEQGPLLGFCLAETARGIENRLIASAHHLLTDAESWRILLADLESAWTEELAGREAQLSPVPANFLHWCERLEQYAQSEALAAELDYWRSLPESVSRLPQDFQADPADNSNRSAEYLRVSLETDATAVLQHAIGNVWRCELHEALLAALYAALRDWEPADFFVVDTEGHGREYLFEDLDISRATGWFTSVYPVHLAAQPARSAGDLLLQIRERVREIPRKGIGYGILRYLRGDAALRSRAGSAVSFNYLGQTDKLREHGRSLVIEREYFGETRSPEAQRAYVLELNVRLEDGKLALEWIFSSALHRRSTIERLSAAFLDYLRALSGESGDETSSVYTPSDFPLAQLEQGELQALAGMLDEVDENSA